MKYKWVCEECGESTHITEEGKEPEYFIETECHNCEKVTAQDPIKLEK